ncbi:Pentatricopeptide repeat-containing protein [Drosera capensis]
MNRELPKLIAGGHHFAAGHHFASILASLTALTPPRHGLALHAHILKLGHHHHTHTATSLTSFYSRFGHLTDARKVFDEMPELSFTHVTALVSGLGQNGRGGGGVRGFRDIGLRLCRVNVNSDLIASVVAGCGVREGIQVHCVGLKLGVERDVYVGTAVLTMYMGAGDLEAARRVFEGMVEKNVVSYNAFVSGLLRSRDCRGVLRVFRGMVKDWAVWPNVVTFVSVLGACSGAQEIEFGRGVHGFIAKVGLWFDTMVGTALVDMYYKCGSLHWGYDVFVQLRGKRNLITWNSMIGGMMMSNECENAVELFNRLGDEGFVPDSATWNTMIHGFSQYGKGAEALMFFEKMQSQGIAAELKSLTSILPACSTLCSLKNGKEIHGYAIRKNLNDDAFLATSLVDMYMKCGESSLAQKIFHQFENKPVDPAIWNAMISGSNGELEKGQQVFRTMIKEYGLIPAPEHFACMVDLLGRSGQLDKAKELLADIPEPNASALSSLLTASGCNLDAMVGEDLVEKLAELKLGNSGPFVTLSNMYAAMGRWKDVKKIRHVMDVQKVKKKRYHDKQNRDFRMSKPSFKDQVDAQSYCICIMGTAGLWHFNEFPCSRDGKLIDFNARNMEAQWRYEFLNESVGAQRFHQQVSITRILGMLTLAMVYHDMCNRKSHSHVCYLIVMGHMAIGNGDSRGTLDGINQAIAGSGQ